MRFIRCTHSSLRLMSRRDPGAYFKDLRRTGLSLWVGRLVHVRASRITQYSADIARFVPICRTFMSGSSPAKAEGTKRYEGCYVISHRAAGTRTTR